MPKIAKSGTNKVKKIVSLYPSEFVSTLADELYCNFCDTVINHSKHFFVENHRNTTKHKKRVICPSSGKSQQFITVNKNDFTKNLLKAFLSADIPLWKLRHI